MCVMGRWRQLERMYLSICSVTHIMCSLCSEISPALMLLYLVLNTKSRLYIQIRRLLSVYFVDLTHWHLLTTLLLNGLYVWPFCRIHSYWCFPHLLFQLANKYWAPHAKNKLPFDPKVSYGQHWILKVSIHCIDFYFIFFTSKLQNSAIYILHLS